jgi:glycosyltransferase involved in cell wall biosynthesis
MKIKIAIFAYNEADNIAHILKDLISQSLMKSGENNIDIYILANGCTDSTVEIAEQFVGSVENSIKSQIHVMELPFKGKSRCWNYFVHEICTSESDILFFVDGDIIIPFEGVFENMSSQLTMSSDLKVINSRPVKDIEYKKRKTNLVESLILKSGGTLTNYKKSICGQLYAVKAPALKDIYMPVGLPVEDGFLRAMLLTELLTQPEDLKRIDGDEAIFHVYESILTLAELINHQTRIMIGSAVNEAVFRLMRDTATSYQERVELLKSASKGDSWLSGVIKKQLPNWPYGYIKFRFLFKRFNGLRDSKNKIIIKKIPIVFIGFVFDFLVYVNATIKMARGKGAGHW